MSVESILKKHKVYNKQLELDLLNHLSDLRTSDYNDITKENKILREDLNQIAYEKPLCPVSGQPVNLITHLTWVLNKARKALEGK